MKKSPFLVLTMLLLLPGQFLFANGNDENKADFPVKIRFAHMWQEGASIESDLAIRILNELDDANPSFTIIHEVVVGDEMRNKIRVDVAANNTPDMWQFWAGGVLKDYADRNILLDMNEYIEASERLNKDDIPQGAWDLVTFNGVKRAVPRNVSIGVFGVNKDLFQRYNLEYPKTWKQFLALGAEFRKHGVTPTNIGSKGGNPSHFWYGDLVCQYQDGVTDTLNIGNTLDFSNPSFRKAAQYSQEMREAGLFPKDTIANGDWSPSYALYEQGNTAMLYTFAWMFGEMSAEMIDKTVLIPIPPVPDAERDTSTFIQGSVNDAYTVSVNAFDDPDRKQAIVTILDTVNKDIALAMSQQGIMVSADNEVMGRVKLEDIDNAMMVKVLKYRLKNNMSGSPMIWQNLPGNKLQFDYQSALDELWSGALNAEEYIAKVQRSCDQYKK